MSVNNTIHIGARNRMRSTNLVLLLLVVCAPASTLSSASWIFPGDFRERFHMSEAVVSGVLMHTLRGGVRTVNGREVTSNIARLRVDRVFQGKVPARELQFVWYSLHWPNTRMGVIYSGPPLAAFEAGKRYLIFLKRRGLGWEVAMPLYELDVELAPELPPAGPRDLSLLSPQHRYESVAEELEAAAFAQPAPATGTTGNAAATFPWVFDLLGGCAEPFYRHFVSVPSPELREAASGWLKFVQSRALPCEASDTSRKRQ